MKLMVDITEKQYSKIKEFFDNGFGCYGTKLDEIIYNGIPLPKGHGRLIDEKSLKEDIVGHQYSLNFCEEHNIDNSINLGMLSILISEAPTIIEADKGE